MVVHYFSRKSLKQKMIKSLGKRPNYHPFTDDLDNTFVFLLEKTGFFLWYLLLNKLWSWEKILTSC